jgi:hypothetical protein
MIGWMRAGCGSSTGVVVLWICEMEIRQFLLDADVDGFLLLVD